MLKLRCHNYESDYFAEIYFENWEVRNDGDKKTNFAI